MQSFKKIYSIIMKLNRFFALHFFANDLYPSKMFVPKVNLGNSSRAIDIIPPLPQFVMFSQEALPAVAHSLLSNLLFSPTSWAKLLILQRSSFFPVWDSTLTLTSLYIVETGSPSLSYWSCSRIPFENSSNLSNKWYLVRNQVSTYRIKHFTNQFK